MNTHAQNVGYMYNLTVQYSNYSVLNPYIKRTQYIYTHAYTAHALLTRGGELVVELKLVSL